MILVHKYIYNNGEWSTTISTFISTLLSLSLFIYSVSYFFFINCRFDNFFILFLFSILIIKLQNTILFSFYFFNFNFIFIFKNKITEHTITIMLFLIYFLILFLFCFLNRLLRNTHTKRTSCSIAKHYYQHTLLENTLLQKSQFT